MRNVDNINSTNDSNIPQVATLTLDLQALYDNALFLMNKGKNVIATVKNNAYNFGLEKAIDTFYKAGIRAFATTSIEEAKRIRTYFNKNSTEFNSDTIDRLKEDNSDSIYSDNFYRPKIDNFDRVKVFNSSSEKSSKFLSKDDYVMVFLLNPSTDFETLRNYDISCSIANLDWTIKNAGNMQGIRWHLEWAGFMRRSGCRSEREFLDTLEFAKNNNINIEGIWTHFAWSDEFDNDNMYEMERDRWLSIQKEASSVYDFKYIHSQNSASFSRDSLLDGHTHIRVGILLYGCPGYDGYEDLSCIKHALELSCGVVTVKTLKEGESIGYCSSFKADKKTTVAVVNIGYGDGLLRKRVVGHEVMINGMRYPLVSMMMSHVVCIVDDKVKVGDKAIFYSKDMPVYEYTFKGVGANSEQISPLNHNSLIVKYIEVDTI